MVSVTRWPRSSDSSANGRRGVGTVRRESTSFFLVIGLGARGE